MASSKERHINETLPVRASFCTEAAVWRLEVGHTLLSDSRWQRWLDESAFYMFDLVSSLNINSATHVRCRLPVADCDT